MLRGLTLILGAGALLGLAGSTALAAHPPAAGPVASSAPPESGAAPAARSEHVGEGRLPPFHGLLAIDEAAAKARLGAPDVARSEGSGAMWTYRLPSCALFVFFRTSQGRPLHVSGAASGPRMRGRSPPPVNECIAQALDRQAATGRAHP